jgi:predicted  nucleic acid-binding Zn-ribbon protein
MVTGKYLRGVGAAIAVAPPTVRRVEGQTSEAARLEKMEQAVEQLEKGNAELEHEVKDLRNRLIDVKRGSSGVRDDQFNEVILRT